MLIALNSLVHVAIFRYRIQYISFLALCLYVGSSGIFEVSSVRKRLSIACALCLLVTNLTIAKLDIVAISISRRNLINKQAIAQLVQKYPNISNDVVELLIAKYKLQ